MTSIRNLKEKLINLKNDIHQVMDYLNFPKIDKKISSLEKEIQKKDIWQNEQKKAQDIQTQLNFLREQKKKWQNLIKEVDELFLLIKELDGEKTKEKKDLIKEVASEYKALKKNFQKLELEVYLGKKYDRRNAIILVYAGAGGIDAQDWTKMLLRMYECYAEKRKFKTNLAEANNTEEGGIKNAVLEIKGKYAYGLLKNEAGVHRLIRISPYSAQSLRHTSFALVEVLPQIKEVDFENFKLNPKDLKINTFKASGPGGQNVNRRETAVRITHLPTGLEAASQKERSQMQNKQRAMNLLLAKIVNLLEKKKLEKIEALKEKVSPEWGNQIRTYVLHPYKQVRDHRSKIELSNVERVLDGDLDKLIEANLKIKT